MKKLIAILSSFVSVFSTASTIIACGSTKPQSGGTGNGGAGGPNGSKINKQLLKTVLSDDGIDGSVLNTKNTEAEVLSLIKQEIIKIEATAINIKFENANEENIVLCEGVNHFKVSFDAKSEHLIYSVIVKNIKNIKYSEVIFNVRGDGSCLFWSIVSAYLLPVRNDDTKLKIRFQELFGKNQLKNLSHVQTLLKDYSLEDTEANQLLYKDKIMEELVRKIFRNNVVDNIEITFNTNRDGQKDIYESGMLHNGAHTNINDYLKEMREESTWGGNVELKEISRMLNCSIDVVNSDLSVVEIRPVNKKPSSSIKLSYSGSHYRFYMVNKID